MQVLPFFIVLLGHQVVGDVDLGDVVFTILSQPQERHADIASRTKEDLVQKLVKHGLVSPQVFTLHQDLPHHGGWTIFPVLTNLAQLAREGTRWFIFLHESSEVELDLLKKVLAKFNQDYEFFVGKAIVDPETTIIHHFSPVGLRYPDFKAGFILSRSLVNTLSKLLQSDANYIEGFPSDFSIDASYELAKVISNLHSNGPILDDEPSFCTSFGPKCAIYPRETLLCGNSTDKRLQILKSTLIAVKTCQKFHSERLRVVLDTWAPAAENLIFVSESTDPDFGTIVLPDAPENTERGHCQKTEAILKYFYRHAENKQWEWLVIVDDDTILSVNKLLELLECYSRANNEPIAIGQRYGFRVARGTHGYDYQTGGSGMIFNVELVKKLVEKSKTHCQCATPDQPDDMHLGACLANLGLTMIHSDRLHQGRPNDYSNSLLEHQDPISFHKFWNNDPMEVYKKWFKSHDQELLTLKNLPESRLHEEL